MSKLIKTVGLIGAGQMGSGIAQAAAVKGFDIMVCDLAEARLTNCKDRIAKGLARSVRKETLSLAESDQALARCRYVTQLESLAKCDLVIEAATEDEAVKRSIFEKLSPLLSKEAILASNTSSLSITRLAQVVARPENFVGIHFFNPVPVMKLVEVITGLATSDEVYKKACDFVQKLDKQVVTVADYPGFVVNRVLIPMINEAIFALGEGVASIADIDQAMKLGTRHPMGPLELADFIGLDTCFAIQSVLLHRFADSKYRPAPLLAQYVDAGWLGRKSGRGFYDYSGDMPKPTR